MMYITLIEIARVRERDTEREQEKEIERISENHLGSD